MAVIYTKNNFTTFQEEIVKSIEYSVRCLDETENQQFYKVYLRGKPEFINSTNMCKCQCQMLGFKGIPCRHIVAVFLYLDVVELPAIYILRMLTREARVATARDSAGKEITGDRDESLALRLFDLQYRSKKVIEEGSSRKKHTTLSRNH